MTKLEDDGFTDLGTPLPTDETITQEQINEMKMLGLPKPDTVSWERWQRIQDIRFEHEHMIQLAASGLSQGKIAEAMGYDHVHVSKVLRHPDVKAAVRQRINDIYGDDHKKSLKDRFFKSVEVVDETLEYGKESEKASMAKWVIEQTVGKASQDVTVKSTSLVEVIHQINQLRDVSGITQSLPKPKDHFDTIIEEVIPKGMVIGKRSTDVGETK